MKDPTSVIVFGAAGRMGRLILELAAGDSEKYTIRGAVESDGHPLIGHPLKQLLGMPATDLKFDTLWEHRAGPGSVIIDFSTPEGTMKNLDGYVRSGLPALIGTTGFSSEDELSVREASASIPLLFVPNTSRGVNVLFWLARHAASLMGPEYDIEIVEMHHHHKQDAPSGTARRLAEVVLEDKQGDYDRDIVHGRSGQVGARSRAEIGMHAMRGGDVAGDHTLVLAGQGERIELTHRASSRETFARGALQAACWLRDRGPGLYAMDHVLGLQK